MAAWASLLQFILGCFAFVVWWVLAVFPAVPFLPIGRTAGSILGATLTVVFQVISPNHAFAAVDLPILGLLFGTMVISVYLKRARLFEYLGRALSWKTRGGKDLLGRLCLLSALSSALFTNDTTCVALCWSFVGKRISTPNRSSLHSLRAPILTPRRRRLETPRTWSLLWFHHLYTRSMFSFVEVQTLCQFK